MTIQLQVSPQPPQSLRSSQLMDVLLWVLRQRRRFRIVGPSMQPLLMPQEEVLIDPHAYRQTLPHPGDLVVARHPHNPDLRLIKWVVYVEADRCFLKGLNPNASTDSRVFGLVPQQDLLGKVLCRFP